MVKDAADLCDDDALARVLVCPIILAFSSYKKFYIVNMLTFYLYLLYIFIYIYIKLKQILGIQL